MSVQNWFGGKKAWKISPTIGLSGLTVQTSGSGKNCFKLKPKWKKGKVVYFTVDYKRGAMPAVWKKVTLFPRGDTPAPVPQLPAPATPPLTASDVGDAATVLATYLQNHASTTERLEGDINVNGERGSLTLVQVPNSVQIPDAPNGSEALLFVFLKFDIDRPPESNSNPDGTGGGHSVHP